MSLLRQSYPFIFSAVAGLATGASLYILYFRLSRELAEIRALIIELKQEIAANNAGNRRRRNYRSRSAGRYSVTASSGDDDDDFEDALAGLSDLELTNYQQNGPVASERNVQFASPVSVEMDVEDSEEVFFKRIDDCILAGSNEDYENALDLMRQEEGKMSQNAQFQWRFSKVIYFNAITAGKRGEAEAKKEMMYTAKEAAQATIDLDPKCADGHKWYSITLGCTNDYEGTSEKIKNGIVIKKHIQLAIELNPKDPTNHHMLGRWCYSVYMLSWLERKAAAAFFGDPPSSTAEEALEHFMEAENLNPGNWKENSLYIGKCLIEKSQYAEAVRWLRLAKAGPEDADENTEVQTEVRSLLAKYDH